MCVCVYSESEREVMSAVERMYFVHVLWYYCFEYISVYLGLSEAKPKPCVVFLWY